MRLQRFLSGRLAIVERRPGCDEGPIASASWSPRLSFPDLAGARVTVAKGDHGRMHRVVDAMNVIGSRPDGWWRDRAGAIEKLVGQVDRWAAERAVERVTVMLEHEPRREIEAERVEVAWASVGGQNAADREIIARLSGWLEEDEVVVVTSDRDLRAKALAAGAEVVSSRPFRAELDSADGD